MQPDALRARIRHTIARGVLDAQFELPLKKSIRADEELFCQAGNHEEAPGRRSSRASGREFIPDEGTDGHRNGDQGDGTEDLKTHNVEWRFLWHTSEHRILRDSMILY